MGEAWTVNSEITLVGFIRKVRDDFEKHRYLTYPAPRIGPDRSLDQNALLHVWLTEFAAELAGCHKREVTRGMLEGIKRTMKEAFYRESGEPWMIHVVKCPLTGREKKGLEQLAGLETRRNVYVPDLAANVLSDARLHSGKQRAV